MEKKTYKETPINYAGEVGINGGTHCGGPGSRVKFVDPDMCYQPMNIPEEVQDAYKEWIKENGLDKYNRIEKLEEYMEKGQIKMVNGETKQGDITLKCGLEQTGPQLQNILIGLFSEVKSNENLALNIMDKTMLLGGEQFVTGPENDEEQPFVSYLDSLETLKNKILKNNSMLENILKEITKIL